MDVSAVFPVEVASITMLVDEECEAVSFNYTSENGLPEQRQIELVERIVPLLDEMIANEFQRKIRTDE